MLKFTFPKFFQSRSHVTVCSITQTVESNVESYFEKIIEIREF